MFSQLQDKLQDIFKDLRGHGRLSEENIAAAMRQIRMALLEADVQYDVAKAFIARIRDRALGEEVVRSVTPGQQVVKIFHDELAALLGGDAEPLDTGKPGRILMVGLNGAGKTTTSAKLAAWLRKQGHRPALFACDLQRPAAMDQLVTLGRQIDLPVFRPEPGETSLLEATRSMLRASESASHTVAIFDTAGRMEIDEPLVRELAHLRDLLEPNEILLVCDAATGQQAVSVAEHFHNALGITGIVLTKLDGDARGGAALSMREVTGRPIKFAGTGEKPSDFEPFHGERMAGRILGMGDVVSLVEKAAEAIDEEEAARLERRLRTASFDLNDFLAQFKMLKKLGPLENLLGMMPGMGKMKDFSVDEKQMKHVEAIVLSMTPDERSRPGIINARRRKRIASGSGRTVTEVNNLLKRFGEMRKLMKNPGKMKKMMAGMNGGARMPGLR